ncbi:reverse transcriptase domain-containing protein [Neisseria elongata]|jgi:hypothetical protein
MKIDGKLIESAYIYLKNHIYYENLNLFMRERISSFEKEHNLLDENVGRNIFEEIAKVISDNNTDKLDEWIDSISFRIIPKSFEDSSHKNTPNSNEEGRFISNDKSTGIHNPEKLNYFIDANVEVYIIDMLWSLYVGPILDGMLTEDCYGNRLRNHAKEFIKEYGECNNTGDVSGHNNLFIRYIDQYNKWRNNAINKARLLSDDNNSVGVVSLDLKEFFYNVDIDLDKVDEIIERECSREIMDDALKLNHLLKCIFKKYYKVINRVLSITHDKCERKKILPIGLTSSSILSNWYMIDFDEKIQKILKPIYYGRYVDDILIVLPNPIFDEDNPLKSLYKKYFLSTHILASSKDDESYIIKGKDISIQKKKVVFQFFDKANSKAGLELFKQELDEQSSAFKFLPTEHFYREMDEFAYEILFSGSSDKLRNVIGVVENETKLSQYLSSCITANRLCKTNKKDKDIVISQLMLFFKGCNSLKFSRLWEKVYQYSFVVNDINFAITFYNHLVKEINIINYSRGKNNFLVKKIKDDLCFYNQISFSLSLALIKFPINKESLEVKNLFYKFPDLNNLMKLANGFRYSNLIRHHLVAWPLSNYTEYKGSLIDENRILEVINSNSRSHKKINIQKRKYSPRFIHKDELQIFELSWKLKRNKLSKWQNKFAKMHKDFVKWEGSDNNSNNNVDKFSLRINDGFQKNNQFKLAIANLIVHSKDIMHALRGDEKPNLSFERQKIIYQILNAAVKEKADLLVLPEVSIPVSWLPFMASFSRRKQIGLIFGLEHWVINKVAFNTLIELLPFSQKEGFKNCYITARVKNHYAPAELKSMNSLGLVAGKNDKNKYSYHKVNWRGTCFATYNCFELADITHRVLFKSEINLLIACVWNKDTNYYQHILESAVRDLHCYTIQVNTSQYGGSCVLQPTKTEQKTLLYVKGGSNPCILTTNLDTQSLRKFHYQHTPLDGDIFKPLPPGFHKP